MKRYKEGKITACSNYKSDTETCTKGCKKEKVERDGLCKFELRDDNPDFPPQTECKCYN